ncbi:P-loop containing nucleoside triphosphate hydrolase protein [Polychaeton citri CBS 116435]|uniref:P-loop containing nucleoside triphosphate hydrolase protein n=1 Tax=Polychaeton citri CBS 116435 TaxID=1314669 RepID=A0A9P4UV29_9PEZI|nr:P-loop containing nucleoside triphosphate hydrolase protein [Polychaeton citri CBS 116435]
MPEIIDDKSEHCIPFILDRIGDHTRTHQSRGVKPPPFFVGLNGVQGAGKTTLVTALKEVLGKQHRLQPVVLSIDDLYLPRTQQEELARQHRDNPLVQHRGQPSTHDIGLGVKVFKALAGRESNVKIPAYDKSAFNGAGDRVPETEWDIVNADGESTEVIIFEGWCVGFRALSEDVLKRKWEAARDDFQQRGDAYPGVLGKLRLDSVQFGNEQLKAYDALTDRLGAFIHIDAEDTQYVYEWRLQQEAAMRAAKGKGMTDEQVVQFVNGYYPAYELYTDALRSGIYRDQPGRQLRLVVGKDRRVQKVYRI